MSTEHRKQPRRDHAARYRKAHAIRAAAKNYPIVIEAAGVEWIEAADAGAESDKPKRFSMTAYTGGPMVVGWYAYPVVIDLAGLKAAAPIPILLNHDPDRIVGHADEVEIGASAVKLRGLVSGASPEAAQVVAAAAQGFPWRASVGARPDKNPEFIAEGISAKANGKTFTGPLYVARKVTLGEVSFVSVAADSRTSAKVAAAAPTTSSSTEKETAMNFEQWIEAIPLQIADLREDQKAGLRAMYDAEVAAAAKTAAIEGKAPETPPPVTVPTFDLDDIRAAFAAHEAMVDAAIAGWQPKLPEAEHAKIRAAATGAGLTLKAKAFLEKWPAARFEAEAIVARAKIEADCIRAERPKGPAIHGSTRDGFGESIECGFARSCGLRNLERHYKPEVLEAADRHHRNIGLQELLLIHAMQAGYAGRMRLGNDNLREVLKAAFSVHSLTTLLTTTGNKILLDGFNAIPQSWREVAQVRSVQDFKTVTAFRLTAALEYEEVGPAGEIKHGTLGQESYDIQAKTYAKMLALTRQDIINDDLGAFNDLRNRLGLGAAIKMNKVFWTAFLAASSAGTFWTAARGNLVTTASLAEAGLTKAVKAFRDLAGPDGNMMNLDPDRILVPTDLEFAARKLYVSQEVRDTTASTKFQTANVYLNKFRPVVIPELGNAAYTGYSLTTWYMLANPAILASAIMCFLNGQESPTIESADADFETLGVQFRGYHDFGASMSEYRASVEAQA